jgi:hypothetical protein
VTDEFTLSYVLKSASRVRLDVFSLTGQKITTLSDEFRPEGLHETRWNSLAAGLSAGCYVVQLTTENGNAQLRLIVR